MWDSVGAGLQTGDRMLRLGARGAETLLVTTLVGKLNIEMPVMPTAKEPQMKG